MNDYNPPYNPEGEFPVFDINSGSVNDSNSEINFPEDSKIKNFCKCFFSATTFKIFAGLVGTAAIVVGSLLAKGIIVLGTAAASLLAAKILIPVGCVILVVLLAKRAFDCINEYSNKTAGNMSGGDGGNI